MNNYLYRVIPVSGGYTRSLVIEYTYNFIQKELMLLKFQITVIQSQNTRIIIMNPLNFLFLIHVFQNVKSRWENHADLSFVVLIVKALVLVSFHLHLFPSHMQVYSCDLKWRNKYLWFVHATIGFSAMFFFFFWFNHSPVLFSWV